MAPTAREMLDHYRARHAQHNQPANEFLELSRADQVELLFLIVQQCGMAISRLQAQVDELLGEGRRRS